jgi:hypothetical protein
MYACIFIHAHAYTNMQPFVKETDPFDNCIVYMNTNTVTYNTDRQTQMTPYTYTHRRNPHTCDSFVTNLCTLAAHSDLARLRQGIRRYHKTLNANIDIYKAFIRDSLRVSSTRAQLLSVSISMYTCVSIFKSDLYSVRACVYACLWARKHVFMRALFSPNFVLSKCLLGS